MLELGCGAGRESAILIANGYDVLPSDGTPELAAIAAENLGREVSTLRFDDIAFDQAFDGIFANACLLHVPRVELPDILQKIAKSLKLGGLFYATLKPVRPRGMIALADFTTTHQRVGCKMHLTRHMSGSVLI